MPGPPHVDRSTAPKRYAAALSGWLVGGLAPPVAAVTALLFAVEAVCGGASDCSWGFELILALPVLLAAFFGTGPALVRRLVGRVADGPAGVHAARTTRWGAATSIVVLYLAAGSGLGALLGALVAVAIGVPAAVALRSPRG